MVLIILLNNKSSIQYLSFACTQLNVLMYRKWLDISNLPIGGTLTSQGEPEINGKEMVLHILQNWSLIIWWFCIITRTFMG